MKLSKVLKGIKIKNKPNLKQNILNICINADKVEEGSLFVCLKGTNFDGHDYVKVAKQNGAVCFVVEQFLDDFDGNQILVEDSRSALSLICKNFFSFKNKIKVVGITGTNGKTTTTSLITHILNSAGKSCGLIGTEGIYYNNQKHVVNMTTPDPMELFYHLKQMENLNIKYAVMEVSAHAIALNKCKGINFVAKGLTNVTDDHLDFFKTLSNYQDAKAAFFKGYDCIKVVNSKDIVGRRLCEQNGKIISYSVSQNADYRASNIDLKKSEYTIEYKNKKYNIKSNLVGMYNVENELLAFAICKSLKIKEETIIDAINTFKSVEGRMNVYKNGNKTVIIDFAHTPDALEKVLNAVKGYAKNKIICVFGCGGNREKEKRPLMGEIASTNSDYVIITDDNPRFEDSYQIASEISAGIKTKNYEIIVDRTLAISKACEMASDGDVVILCGKGAENYLDIKGVKYDYSDRQVVLNLGFKE